MKNTINANSVGLAFGGVLGLWHVTWSVLVALGWAQTLLDWILSLHMLQIPMTVLPFSLPMAASLVVVTSVFGYVGGYVLCAIWNAVQK
jgi:hypothetical protein